MASHAYRPALKVYRFGSGDASETRRFVSGGACRLHDSGMRSRSIIVKCCGIKLDAGAEAASGAFWSRFWLIEMATATR